MSEAQETVSIQQRLMEFVQERVALGQSYCNVSKLMGDASTRQYFRLIMEDSQSFIVAVYPESFELENFPYYQVYKLFRRVGVPVPEALAFDGRRGIVMQQDLGNESLQRRLLGLPLAGWEPLLKQAIDLIARVQSEGTQHCPGEYQACQLAFDYEKLLFEFDFFFQHYVAGYRGMEWDETRRLALYGEFEAISHELASQPRYLAHRDYHCRNIMLVHDQMYLIDFQDARMGPAAYDLVSILKDSIDMTESTMHLLVRYFLSLKHLRSEDYCDFWKQFEVMSVQRLLKALGTYGYQITTRGNFIYQQYIPGTLHRAYQSVLKLKRFPQIQTLLEREIFG
ncbi:MAG: phosphotransferase [Acidobacteria bacterium]|nr:phosphotransferase [Acidobacteriota bacterium]